MGLDRPKLNDHAMEPNEKFFDFGVKYGLPIGIIAATMAMIKASGWGKLGVFAVSTPLLLLSLLSLGKAQKGELFPKKSNLTKTDNLFQN